MAFDDTPTLIIIIIIYRLRLHNTIYYTPTIILTVLKYNNIYDKRMIYYIHVCRVSLEN